VDCFTTPQQLIEKSNMYHLNVEQNIARFFPCKTSWRKKLNSIEHFHSSLFPSGGLHFGGKISIERFLEAMQSTLQDFDFLFCRFYMEQDDLYAGYSGGTDERSNSFVQLEIDERDETINTAALTFILPDKIDERMRTGIVDHLEGLPIGTFKLTSLKDGFAIGYYLNHAFFDQSSIVYFFKYLSHIYSHGNNRISLKKPMLVDIESLKAKQSPVFKDLTDLRLYGESIGLRSNKTDDFKVLSAPYTRITADLQFSVNKINHLKGLSDQFISTNDIIHATLLKIYSLNPELLLDKTLCFTFPCNMRKRCGLGAEVMGNVVSICRMLLNTEYIKNATILELAKFNRQYVSDISIEKFKENLTWYRHIQKINETALDYLPSTFNLLHCGATNWSTFSYDNIIFNECTPLALKTPCFASLGISIISFDNASGKRILNASICVPSNCFGSLVELGRNTELFLCKERS